MFLPGQEGLVIQEESRRQMALKKFMTMYSGSFNTAALQDAVFADVHAMIDTALAAGHHGQFNVSARTWHQAAAHRGEQYLAALQFLLDELDQEVIAFKGRADVRWFAALSGILVLLGVIALVFTIIRSTKILVARQNAQLSHTTGSLSSLVDRLDDGGETADKVTKISSAVGEVSLNTNQISVAVNEIDSLISSLAERSHQINGNTSEANSELQHYQEQVQKLGSAAERNVLVAEFAIQTLAAGKEKSENLITSADKIGSISNIIAGIARQTNLLALNATIEAVAAGESGRGFAVVASEVKALAAECGKYAGEIQQLVEDVQEQAQGVDVGMQDLDRVIVEIKQVITSFSQSAQQQAGELVHVAGKISEIDGLSTDMSASLQQVNSGTNELSENASGLAKQAQVIGSDIHIINSLSTQGEETAKEVRNDVQQLRGMSKALDDLFSGGGGSVNGTGAAA